MRRTLAAYGVALVTALAVSPAAPALAEDDGLPAVVAPTLAELKADRALAVASRVLAGDAVPADPSPTMALLDLRLSLPDLGTAERRTARALLARPTDGPGDLQGDGYTVSARRSARRTCACTT